MRIIMVLSLMLVLVTLQACGQRAALVPPENRIIDTQSH